MMICVMRLISLFVETINGTNLFTFSLPDQCLLLVFLCYNTKRLIFMYFCTRWKILLIPKGNIFREDSHIAVGLKLDTLTLPPNTKLLVNYMFRLKGRTRTVWKKHHEDDGENLFFSFLITKFS